MVFLKNTIIRLLPCILAVSLIYSGQALAEEGSSSPIHIEADRMISKEEKNSVVFVGNVDARQDDVIIRSDEMTVYYKSKEQDSKAEAGDIEKLICIGNVEVTRGDWLGTGRRMDYYANERKVVLSGDAKAWKGQNMVKGKTITYYLDEGRSIVEQDRSKKDSGRVKATIHPNKDKKE
jgi:lipopolysaccharide export system protein LptA